MEFDNYPDKTSHGTFFYVIDMLNRVDAILFNDKERFLFMR
jgi:hypothetical protein